MAVGGAGLAAGVGSLVTATPAAAATNDLVLGSTTNAATSITVLTVTGEDVGGLTVTDSFYVNNEAVALQGFADGEMFTTGVWGFGSPTGYGVAATGEFAPLLLTASATAGAPATGVHRAGEVYVDSNGEFWACVTGGTPGTWRSLVEQLSLVNPPLRAYDSRTTEGGPGPLAEGATSAHISLTAAGVPAGASGALINLTVVDTVDAGFLTVFEAGGTRPETSNIDWYQSGQILANNATTSLSTAAALQVYSGGVPGAGTDFLIDVFGYYS